MERGIFDLSGKNVLITGATGGLGSIITKGVARFGGNVIIVGRNVDKLNKLKSEIESETASGVNVWVKSFDITQINEISTFFNEVVNEVDSVDVLINCAGINLRGPAEEIEKEVWDKVITTNLSAVFFLSQEFCKHRKSIGRGGKIVNIGSLMCQVARSTTVPYCASKGGLAMLTKGLAVEWAKYGINVNAIGPGYFLTEMTKPLAEDKEFNDWVIKSTPIGRWGNPEDLIGAVVFLSSSASDFITGQIIYVDGGWLASV